MKYVIAKGDRLKEVTEKKYEEWIENSSRQYTLPEYSVKNNGIRHTIDTDFVGALNEENVPFPFVLFHFEDKTIKFKNELRKVARTTTEYFETFEELKKRRAELIKFITKN